MRARLAIIIGPKGRGSNMKALATACAENLVPADVSVVISPKADTPAVAAAEEMGLRVAVVAPSETYGQDLLSILHESGTTWIALAGYLRLLPVEVLRAFPNRILNIHPALLPKFGGKGMYGMHVHEAVLAAGEAESGCTVHQVNEHYDEGRVLLQLRCPVEPGATPETLAARVLELEHRAFPEALRTEIERHGP